MVKLLSLFFLILFSQVSFAQDSAIAVLMKHGFKQEEVARVLKQAPEIKELDSVAEIQKYSGSVYNPERFTLKIYSAQTNDAYLISKDETNIDVEKSEVNYEIETKTISGDIRNTLFDTISRETQSTELANKMTEAFKDDFSSMKGIRVNASYEMEVAQYYDDGQLVKYGDILKASLVIGRATSRKILKLDAETFGWSLQPEDASLTEKPFYAPVRSSRVSSLFQLNRRHPVTRRHQPHNGIDFVATSGTPIYPALDGEVITISRTRSKGKYITILHDNGYQTTYIHLKKFQKGLRVGMRVGLEDQIGEVGRTGYSTGAHLHFGVIKDGMFINPIYLLKNYCYDQKDQFESTDLEEQAIIEGEVPLENFEE